jgi:predicted branched-subunit amino acid permease
MKIQDALFITIFIILLRRRDTRAFVWAGLISLLVAIPLFSGWIFFTAERLTWYAAGFFFISIAFSLRRPPAVQ